MAEYDIAVIGAGPGGYIAAIRAGQLGARTVVIERAELGGTCLNRGCIPTKAMLSSAALYLQTKRLGEMGLTLQGEVVCDWSAIQQRKNKIVQTLRNGIAFLFRKYKIEQISGEATLAGTNKIAFRNQQNQSGEIIAKKIIIATGSKPALIPAFNIEHTHIFTSDDAVSLERLPESMIIVGAGAIGCECATLFSAFGVKIILIELLPRILPLTPLPESITQRLTAVLKRRGVEIITNAKISSLVVKNSQVEANLQTAQSISAEMALVSIGRELNTNNIGLEQVGIKSGPGNAVIIDEFMRTNHPHIYAVGDITGKQQLAHLASRQGVIAAENACGKTDLEPINYQAVPWCIFTEPPIGFVGASEQELQQKGIEYKVAEFPYQAIGVAHCRSELEGRVWLIADTRTQRLLGGSIYGYAAPELIHLVALGMGNSLTIKEMQRLICAHPTFAETIGESLEALSFLPLHL